VSATPLQLQLIDGTAWAAGPVLAGPRNFCPENTSPEASVLLMGPRACGPDFARWAEGRERGPWPACGRSSTRVRAE